MGILSWFGGWFGGKNKLNRKLPMVECPVGVTQSEAIPDIRKDLTPWGKPIKGMGSHFVDLSAVPSYERPNLSSTNRQLRYKEYEKFINKTENSYAKLINPIAERIYKSLNLDDFTKKLLPISKVSNIVYQVAMYGDWFGELVRDPDNLHLGVLKVIHLPPCNVYRIETIKGKLLEFQQSKEGPDLQAVVSVPIEKAHENVNATAIRFHPNDIVHIRCGDRKYYPYGTSCLEQNPFDGDMVLGEPVLDDVFELSVADGIIELVSRIKDRKNQTRETQYEYPSFQNPYVPKNKSVTIIGDKSVEENIDKAFSGVVLSTAKVNDDLTASRSVNVNCHYGHLFDASGLQPDNEFFTKLGKKFYKILYTGIK